MCVGGEDFLRKGFGSLHFAMCFIQNFISLTTAPLHRWVQYAQLLKLIAEEAEGAD